MPMTLLAADQVRELPFPPAVFGIAAFVLLTLLLVITLAIGKGRPHS
jgi:hypothetical protein